MPIIQAPFLFAHQMDLNSAFLPEEPQFLTTGGKPFFAPLFCLTLKGKHRKKDFISHA